MRLSELLVSIGLEAKGLRKMNQQLGETQRNFRKAFGNIQKSVQQFGQNMTRMVTLPLAGLAVGAVKSAADLERLETSFISLTGSAGNAAAMMQNLNAFTARTPFQIEQVATAARQLMASGSGIGEVNTQLQFLGDIAATSGSSIEEIAAIFSKVNAKGKVELESLNQLAERGIPIFKALSDATGLPADKLGAGRVTVEQFNDTLKSFAQQGGFASGAMQRLSETAAGKLSTAMDNLKIAGAELVESLMPHIKAFLDMIVKVAQGFANMSEGAKASILIVAGLLAVTGPIATAVAALVPIIGAISLPVAAVAAAFIGLTVLIVKNFEQVEPVLIDIINAVIQFQNKTKLLTAVWEGVKAGIMIVVAVIKAAFMQTLSFISGVLDAVVLLLDGEFSKAGERMLTAFGEMDEHGRQMGQDIGDAILEGITNTVTAPDVELMEQGAISSAVDGLIQSFQTAFDNSGGVSVPVSMDTGDGDAAGGGETGFSVMNPMADWFTDDVVQRADNFVERMVNTTQMLAEHFQQIGGAINQSLGSAFDVLLENGDNMKEQLTNIGRQLMQNLLKIAIGNAIAAAFSPLSADNAATGGLAGIAKSALLQGMIPSMMPKLRRGGLAFGPTTAVVGDNIGAKVDPEVIAPLSKLKNMMGGQGLSASVSGRDIILTSSRDRNRSRRTYGSFAFS
jgi:tape measure domain-containing protein